MTHNAENDAPRCNCSLGWQFQKGSGPDPARCPVHGDPTTFIPPAVTEEAPDARA